MEREISQVRTRNGALTRSRTSSGILDSLRRDIIMNKFAPGTNITEQFLSDKYGISRSPVRAMFQQLEKEGMIKILENGCKQVVGFTKKDAQDLYTLRRYIETTAVQKVIRGKNKNYVPLLEVLSACQDNNDDKEDVWPAIDFDFHRSMILMSGDRYLLSTYDSFEPTVRTLFHLNLKVFTNKYFNDFYDDHIRIVKSLLSDNEQECIDMIAAHIDGALGKTLNMLDKLEKGGVTI